MSYSQLGLFASVDVTSAQSRATPLTRTKVEKILAASRTIAMALVSDFVKRTQINAAMNQSFGGNDATGAWDAQDANNSLEAALVKSLLHRQPLSEPQSELRCLQSLGNRFEGEYRRSDRTEHFQQFSTPVQLAYVAALAAGIGKTDIVLEPSAGTGMLAVQAHRLGAKVIVNELDEDRYKILLALFGEAYNYDALQLVAYLGTTSPSVVLMNPPFSVHAAAGISKDSTYGVRHILQAATLLAAGGRLVAIVGEGHDPERSSDFEAVLALGKLRANIRISGSAYTRMGTSFGTRIIALDKGANLPDAEIVRSDVELSVEEALRLVAMLPARASLRSASVATVAGPLFTAQPFRAATGGIALASQPAARRRIEAGAVAVPYEIIDAQAIADDDDLFAEYRPQRVRFPNAQPHGAHLVQTQAMAAVLPPVPTYVPLLSPLAQSRLSEAQLEVAVYAGNAHQQHVRISWDDRVETVRRGYYCGDSTGVGKGRISASIIADNFAQGRTRALWVSERATLIEDATRDWTALGGDEADLIQLSKVAPDAEIGARRGILFSTYALLRSRSKTGRSRLDQIIDWLDDDFDGVIALDEAHNAANALSMPGNGRPKGASLQALAVLEIQRRLPQARVVYLSATAATQIEGLAYAERLGIWGAKPAAFDTRENFLSTISSAGTGGLEIACRDLKAMGVYLSRALSMRGVEYELVEHKLTDWDRQTYDTLNRLWRHIEAEMETALQQTGVKDAVTGKTLDRDAVTRIQSQLQATKLRVYAAFLTTIKLPTVLALAQQKLDDGNSLILQIANTYEATLDRAVAGLEGETLDDVDLSPKDMIEQFLDSCFPTIEHEIYLDEDGKERSRPVLDEAGRALINREALAIRQALIADLSNYTIPAAPLDLILEHFGTERVAEITGRSKRIVTKLGPDGQPHRYLEKRGPSANIDETHAFQDGKKRILIFSSAGSTGRSYHADKNAGNRQKRTHILLQAGWQATVAMQGLGRSHRTNQQEPPEYLIVTTDVPGEKRLTSTIARRLESLGAMTRGERNAIGGGLFSAADNLETPYAGDAVSQLIKLIDGNAIATIDRARFEAQTLLKTGSDQKAATLPVPRFLNRVLACDLDLQEAIIEAFFNAIEEIIASARAQGRYDEGVRSLRALAVKDVRREVIFEDPQTKAQAQLVELECTRNKILHELPSVVESIKRTRRILGDSAAGFFEDEEHGVHARKCITIDGQRHTRIFTPFEEHVLGGYFNYGMTELDLIEGQHRWAARVATEAQVITESRYLVEGNILPIWTLLPNSQPQIYQVRLPGDRRLLGRMIDVSELGTLRHRLGLAQDDSLTIDEVVASLQRGRTIYAGRYPIAVARVNEQTRFEVHDHMLITRRAILEANYNVFFERHAYRWRAFIPTDPVQAKEAIRKLAEGSPLRATA